MSPGTLGDYYGRDPIEEHKKIMVELFGAKIDGENITVPLSNNPQDE